MPHRSLSPAKAAAAARRTAHQEKTMPADIITPPIDENDWAGVPIADSPEDVTTRTIPLDGGTAEVVHVDGRTELTVQLGQRIACALVLSPVEAEQIGNALARPGGWTVGDYLAIRDQLDGAR